MQEIRTFIYFDLGATEMMKLMRLTAVLGNDWLEWAQKNCRQYEKCEAYVNSMVFLN